MGLYLRSQLRPMPWPIPFDALVSAWIAAELEPAACRAAIERALADGMPEGLLDPGQVTSGGIVATPALLYGNRADGPWRWNLRGPTGPNGFAVDRDVVPQIGELIRIAARASCCDEAVAEASELLDDATVLDAYRQALDDPRDHRPWPVLEGGGVSRREHASLVIRSSGGTTLVLDPQRLSPGWPSNHGAYPSEEQWLSSYVIVTHSHDDHWCLASIASYQTDKQYVVVPRVPVASLLADDMAGLLGQLDQPVAAPAWWDRITIDDIDVEVLPFYGEQPARRDPLPDQVRNWGNCYRFELDGWSLAILVDSGEDAEGSMVEVLRRSADQHGPIDVVMSSCAVFPEMLNLGLPHYAFVLPFELLRKRWAERASMTSGPRGIAEACRAAGARYFCPYAHSFYGLHTTPINEVADLASVREELSRLGSATEVLDWRPGDILRWRNGGAVIERT